MKPIFPTHDTKVSTNVPIQTNESYVVLDTTKASDSENNILRTIRYALGKIYMDILVKNGMKDTRIDIKCRSDKDRKQLNQMD